MDTVNRAPIGTSGDMPLPMNFETLFAGDQSDGNDFDWSEFFPGAGIDLPGDLPVPAAPTEESDTGLEPSDQAESAGGGTHASSGSDSGSDSEADSETSGAEPESPAGSVGSAPYAGVQPDRGAFHNAQGMGYQQSTVERTQSHYQSTSTIEQPPYQPTNNIRQPSYQPTNIHPQSQSVPHGSYSTQAGSGLTNGIISSYGDAQPNYGFYNAPGFDAPVSQAPAPSQTAYGFSGGDRSGQPSVQQLYGHFSTPDLFPPPMSAPGLYTRSNAATWNGPPVTGGSASSSSGNSYMQQLGPPPAPWQAASSGFAPVRRDNETDVPTDQGFGTASSALTGPGTVRQSTQTSYMMFGDQLPNFKLVPGYEQYGLMVNASDFFPSLYPAMLDGEMYTKHKLAGHCDRLNRRLIAIKSLEVETGPQSGRNEHSQRLQNKAAAEFKYEYTSGVTLVPYSQGKPGSGDDASLTSAHWSECIRLLYKPLIAAQRWVDETHPGHNDPLRVPLIEVAHALILVRSLLARPVDYQSFHYFLHLLVNMGLPEYQKARDTVTTYCQGDPYVFRDLYLHNQWGPRVPQMEAIKSEHH